MADAEFITKRREQLENGLRDLAAKLVDLSMPIPERLSEVQSAINMIESRIYNGHDAEDAGVKYVVRPDSVFARGGVIRRGTFLCCGEIEELVFEEGIVSLEDGWWEGLPRLRKVSLPASLQPDSCTIPDPVEEAVFVEGCRCTPRFSSTSLKRVVWPSGCDTCRSWTFNGCDKLTEVIGFEKLKCIHAYAFERMDNVKIPLPGEFVLAGLDLYEEIPSQFRQFVASHREKAVSLLATVRDLSRSVPDRVDAWLELTSSNVLVRSLPEDVQSGALRSELPIQYKALHPMWTLGDKEVPRTASAGGRKVLAEFADDNYTAARILMDMTRARPTQKWLTYAWATKKHKIISGFLRDRHPLAVEWVKDQWKRPLYFLLENLSNPVLAKPIVECFPDLAKCSICGCSRLLWEFLVSRNYRGDGWLCWNGWHSEDEMRNVIKTCEDVRSSMIELGADPTMKGAPLHFSWDDIVEGLRRRYPCKQ